MDATHDATQSQPTHSASAGLFINILRNLLIFDTVNDFPVSDIVDAKALEEVQLTGSFRGSIGPVVVETMAVEEEASDPKKGWFHSWLLNAHRNNDVWVIIFPFISSRICAS